MQKMMVIAVVVGVDNGRLENRNSVTFMHS